MLAARSEALRRYLGDRYPGATISDLQFITSGSESDIYTFTLYPPSEPPRPLILRPYLGDGAAQKLIRETNGFRQLQQAGYPIPGMLLGEADPAVLGHPFVIIEKLEGQALWPLLAGVGTAQANHLLDRFGGLLAWLHQLDWRSFSEQAGLYQAQPAAILDELLAVSRQLYTQFDVGGFLAIADWLERRIPEIAVRPAVVHMDFHANNVFLCNDDRLAVIDWTQCAVSDYRVDLSWTLMIMGDYGDKQWADRILQAYSAAAPYPVTNLDYFNVITYTKLLASTVISLKHSPEKLGLRAQTADALKQQAFALKMLSQRIQDITGLSIPEVGVILSQIGD